MDTNNKTPGWTQIINTISTDLWNSAEGGTHKWGHLLPRPQPYRKERVLQAPARATGLTVNTNPRAQPDGSFCGGQGPTPQWLVASHPPLGRSPALRLQPRASLSTGRMCSMCAASYACLALDPSGDLGRPSRVQLWTGTRGAGLGLAPSGSGFPLPSGVSFISASPDAKFWLVLDT